MYAYPSNK